MPKPTVVQMLWHMPVDFSGSIEKVGVAIARHTENVSVLTIGKENDVGEWPADLPSWSFKEARRRWKLLRKLWPSPPFQFPDLVRFLDEKRPDIIHFHVRHVHVDVLVGLLSYRPKVVVHYHGRNSVNLDKPAIEVPRSADILVAVSDAMKRHIQVTAQPSQPVITIHNPVPDWALQADTDILPKSSNEVPVLLYCGGKHEAKGYHQLKSAIQQIAAPFRLWVAGPDLQGDDWHDPRVEILGMLRPDQLRARMFAADAVVMPSINEALGLVALEALATKTLLVASSADGLAEIVEPTTAIVVTPGSVESLAEGLTRALILITDDPRQRMAMLEAGRLHIENYFSPAAFGKKVSELYQSLTS